jgi:hypothetical protein
VQIHLQTDYFEINGNGYFAQDVGFDVVEKRLEKWILGSLKRHKIEYEDSCLPGGLRSAAHLPLSARE